MCQVHIVPELDEIRKADGAPRVCGECKFQIFEGSEFRFIEGVLDDGSDHRYRYEAHEECYRMSVDDVGSDGCFTYGGARRLDPGTIVKG